MKTSRKIFTAHLLRSIARYTLLISGILIFFFALLSGAEQSGGGISGLLKNSPNALPWLILLICLFIAWKHELAGGISIIVFGIGLLVFFVLISSRFHPAMLIMSLIPVIFGSFFIISHYLSKSE
jgi:hypothetical protein